MGHAPENLDFKFSMGPAPEFKLPLTLPGLELKAFNIHLNRCGSDAQKITLAGQKYWSGDAKKRYHKKQNDFPEANWGNKKFGSENYTLNGKNGATGRS